MKNKIIELATRCGADVVGFAPYERFEKNDPIFKLLPEVKTVIGLVFRVLRGAYRGIEEGSTYYQYPTMGVSNMEETVMPLALMHVSMMLEENGFNALPQMRSQQIMSNEDSVDPEINHKSIYRSKKNETKIDFLETAVKCGLGEIGMHGALLTDEFGPMVRYCFILTDAIINPTEIKDAHLCDKCGKCADACPGKAISKSGEVDKWQCAAYYAGACGLKNPFMPPDAFSDFEDRLEIIAGEAKVSPEKARKILDNLYFYPSVGHCYQPSICGRACDMACYSHLEEQGLLTKKFKSPFKKREEWKFDIESFK